MELKLTRIALVIALGLAPACGDTAPPSATSNDVAMSDARLREVETQLFGLMNEARVAEGKHPLERNDELSSVARAHSTDMRDHDFFSHQSPTTGTPDHRLTEAGTRSSLVLENIGKGVGAVAIHDGWTHSASHKANMMNPDVTHAGVGVVAKVTNGEVTYVATVVFARLTAQIDVAQAPRELFERVNRIRVQRNAPPLEWDDNLSTAAQHAASKFFTEPTSEQQSLVDEASASMRRFAIQFRRLAGVMTTISDLDEAVRLEPVLDPSVHYVGVGVAQGTRVDTPSNALSVCFMLGWSR